MNLADQLQQLIKDAPNYGVSEKVMEKAVVPVLELFALPLQCPDYYIWRTPDQSWVITTLSRKNTTVIEEKRVVYAFSGEKNAQNFQNNSQSSLKMMNIPVTHLLFQLFSVEGIDSIIFLENGDNLQQGKEIQRLKLQSAIYEELKRFKSPSSSFYA